MDDLTGQPNVARMLRRPKAGVILPHTTMKGLIMQLRSSTRLFRFLFVLSLMCFTRLSFAQSGGLNAEPTIEDVAIPADAEHATQALIDSPRHGEWANVDMPGSDVKIKTWISYPERSDKAPVVIVIHEIFGMSDWVRAVADQLAAEGYIAVAPDLLSGKGPNGGGTESFEGDSVRSAIRELSREDQVARLNAVRSFAIALPSASDKCGSIGFCWGGSASFAYATSQKDVNAAVVYYGTAPNDEAALSKIGCPVLGLYGGDDARVTSTVEPTAALMKKLEKTYTHHTYKGAGHGFLRQQSARDGANLAAAKAAWKATIEFFKNELE